ncbi:MAG: response regulator [Nitrosopumilus sp.]|nr:response regulator [Nitrosopumilus sp.]
MQDQEILLNDTTDTQDEKLDEITLLQDFGLEKDEAQIYFALVKLGSVKASEISTFTKINRVRTYKILENLKNSGFVTSTLSSPIKFSANDPETSLKSIILKQKQKITDLEKNISKFLKILSQQKLYESQIELPKLTIISNRKNIYEQMIKLIEDTKDELYMAISSSDIIRLYYTAVPEIIEKITKQNITIKLMTDYELSIKHEYVKRLGINYFKIVTLPSSGRLLCNKSQVLMSNNTSPYSNKNIDKESAMITNSSDIVSNMNSFCDFLWETGKEINIKNKNNKKEKKLQKQFTVLVVDDDEDSVNILSDYLEVKGISNIKKCTDGKNALKICKKIHPNVIFLDIMIPDFDGFYVLDQIRKIDSKLKVIIVTADTTLDTKKRLEKANPTDVIYKPYDIKKITRHLKL